MRLDRHARRLNGGRTVLGGQPLRAMRFSAAGAGAVDRMLAGCGPASDAERALARRLSAAGILHPPVTRAPVGDVTVVIPVRDRPRELARCLAALGPIPARVLVVDDGSLDAGAVIAVCARHGAEVLRREVCGGPAAARNAALAQVDSELVAFLDSDCVPTPGWLEILCGALADGEVDVVAPRIAPLATAGERRAGALARFAAARSPLDLGAHPAVVAPGAAVAYVPTAALLARRSVLGAGFDPALRYGEDVDLIWRLHDAGHVIRYEPAAVVNHAEPERAVDLFRRRFHYGTSAGPLARRHPGRLAPVILHPWPGAVIALALANRPRAAALVAGIQITLTAHRLRDLGLAPLEGARLGARGITESAAAIGRANTMLLPLLLSAGLVRRRTRPGALAFVLIEPLRSWARERPDLDPLRWSALAVADDVAYGAGVWAGALGSRTAGPLTPRWVRGDLLRRRSLSGRPGSR